MYQVCFGLVMSSPKSKSLPLYLDSVYVEYRYAFRYPYISHLICNAGCGSFDGINWPVAIKQVFTHPFVGVTVTDYKRQTSGRMSDNGLGFVWQCNVFAHYVLVSHPLAK